ncbi:MAG TPA: DUF4232 domain-containing protein [Trebonia sp.]
MPSRTSAALTICVFAAGLTAAGCSASSSSSSSAGPSATSSANPGSTAHTGSTGTAASQSPAPQAQAAGTCQPADLSLALRARSGVAGQPALAVDLTNKGSSACTMEGFPGVNLVGAANGKQDYAWPLLRSSASYSKVTLQPGGTAHFDLRYLPGVSGDGTNLAVVKMVITPPNADTQAEVTWNQPVLLQDGATHPGTYITPVMTGS